MAISKAHAHWEGSLLEGAGTVTTDSPALDGVVMTWKSRIGGEPGTTPEELLGAAHASCFSMAFSGSLAKAGHPPRSLDVNAEVEFGPVEGGNAVTAVTLEVAGDVPGIDESEFERLAEGAKVGCPISKALAGNVEITLRARLTSVA